MGSGEPNRSLIKTGRLGAGAVEFCQAVVALLWQFDSSGLCEKGCLRAAQASELAQADEATGPDDGGVQLAERHVCGGDHMQLEVIAQKAVCNVEEVADAIPATAVTGQEQILRILKDSDLLLLPVVLCLLDPEAHEARVGEHFRL